MPVVFLLMSLASAPPKPSVAVFTLEAETGVPASTSRLVTDALVTEVRSTGGFSNVVSFREVEAVLTMEQQRQVLSCNAQSCAAEVAASLGVDTVIVGNLGKLGESFILNLRLLNTRNGNALATITSRVKSANEEGFLDAIPQAVSRLMMEAKLGQYAAPAPAPTPPAAVEPPAVAAPVAPPAPPTPTTTTTPTAPPEETAPPAAPSRKPLFFGAAGAAAGVGGLAVLVAGAGIAVPILAALRYTTVVGSHKTEYATYGVMGTGAAVAVLAGVVALGGLLATVALAGVGVMQ